MEEWEGVGDRRVHRVVGAFRVGERDSGWLRGWRGWRVFR